LCLTHILIDQACDFGLRQLAGVLFKQFCEIHWSQNSEKFVEPEVDLAIKQRVKQILPMGLNDQSSKIRTTVAFAISTIAHFDWPELWPELFGFLLNALSVNVTIGSNMNGVHGALVTLSEIINEVTDIQMPTIAPAIIPQVYKIFIDPQSYSIDLRKRAIEIFTAIINVIAEMAEYDSTCGKQLIGILLICLFEYLVSVIALKKCTFKSLSDFMKRLSRFNILIKFH